jgi:hypothetical protein
MAAQAANWLGAIYVARRDYTNAEALMLPGSDQFTAPAAEMSANERRLAIGHMVNLYHALGKRDEEAAWQKKLDSLTPTATTQ